MPRESAQQRARSMAEYVGKDVRVACRYTATDTNPDHDRVLSGTLIAVARRERGAGKEIVGALFDLVIQNGSGQTWTVSIARVRTITAT